MSPALDFAPSSWLLDFLEERGIPCSAEDGFHYFPISGRARDILDAFLSECRKLSVEIRCASRVRSLHIKEGSVAGIEMEDGSLVEAGRTVLACGGMAWPRLGGCADGLDLARSAGHAIVKPLPAMAPVCVKDEWVKSLSGVSLPDASLSVGSGRSKMTCEGELLFTHDGLSGPAALDVSGEVAKLSDESGETPLSLCVKPGWGRDEWTAEIDSWRNDSGRKLVRSSLAKHLPHSLADALCSLAGCLEEKSCALRAESRRRLAETLAETTLSATGTPGFEKAMAMKGGVSLKEIRPDTLESRVVKGLFFAGELLDVVGPCGGYNIQWAFSSGSLAGASAAKR